jgi:hypothetical protein
MVVQVLAGLVVVVLSGVAGAAYQIHKRRSRPFLVIDQFSDGVAEDRAEVDVPEEVQRRLKEATFLDELDPRCTLRELHGVRGGAKTVKTDGAELRGSLRTAVDNLSRATSDDQVIKAITRPLQFPFFDAFLIEALKRAKIELSDLGAGTKVRITAGTASGGCYYLGLKGKPTRFGSNLDEQTYLRDLVQPFLSLVGNLNREHLLKAFSELSILLDDEINIADAVFPSLDGIYDSYSQWEARMFVANHGESGMFVLPDATLEVRKARFDRAIYTKCKLAVYQRDSKGAESTVPEIHAVPVPPGTATTFSLITRKSQSEMTEGGEFRGRFMDGKSQARVALTFLGPGFRQRHSARSRWVRFAKGPIQ